MKERDFDEIIGELKRHIFRIKNFKKAKKVTDVLAAQHLDILPGSFATLKKRGTIPYSNILRFCIEHNVDANTLFYDVKA